MPEVFIRSRRRITFTTGIDIVPQQICICICTYKSQTRIRTFIYVHRREREWERQNRDSRYIYLYTLVSVFVLSLRHRADLSFVANEGYERRRLWSPHSIQSSDTRFSFSRQRTEGEKRSLNGKEWRGKRRKKKRKRKKRRRTMLFYACAWLPEISRPILERRVHRCMGITTYMWTYTVLLKNFSLVLSQSKTLGVANSSLTN